MRTSISTRSAVGALIGLFMLISIVSVAVGATSPWFLLDENQVLYLFSTSAQVIAALYGLTLTGFIFFRNELSREGSEDETLIAAVDSLKLRYFQILAFVTALVLLTLLFCNLAIAYPHRVSPVIAPLVLNVGQALFVTSLAGVSFFTFDVVSPHRIQIASQKIQDELDPQRSVSAPGDLSEFLKNYNQVELLLQRGGFATEYSPLSDAVLQRQYTRRISNVRLAEILLKSERINGRLFSKLRELITLRNAIIHGAEPVVSRQMVDSSAAVLNELSEALQKKS